MKTIVKQVIKLETKRHDFDNDFAYVEVWRNNTLTDCYLAEKQYLWPDGSLKLGGIKYFYSPLHDEEIEKEIKPLNYKMFNSFSCLYYFDEDGDICQIESEQTEASSIREEVNCG